MSGQVVHFEIPADDVARARRFYAETFGWKINPMPTMDYTVVHTTPTDENGMTLKPGAINGGILARREPVQGPVITIDVADLDATLTRIEQSGGKTLSPKQPVGTMGYVGYFSDPEGNVIGLWQNAS